MIPAQWVVHVVEVRDCSVTARLNRLLSSAAGMRARRNCNRAAPPKLAAQATYVFAARVAQPLWQPKHIPDSVTRCPPVHNRTKLCKQTPKRWQQALETRDTLNGASAVRASLMRCAHPQQRMRVRRRHTPCCPAMCSAVVQRPAAGGSCFLIGI